jgi:hypothetical protein
MLVTQAMDTPDKAFDALVKFTTIILGHPTKLIPDRGDALESVIENFFFFAATCAVEFNTAVRSFEAVPLSMDHLFPSLVLSPSKNMRVWMKKAKILPSVFEVESVPLSEKVPADNLVELYQDEETIYIQKAVKRQAGFDFAVTFPTNKGPLVLLIETHGNFKGRDWEGEKTHFTKKWNLCKKLLPTQQQSSSFQCEPKSRFVFLYVCTSDLSSEFKEHLKDSCFNPASNGDGEETLGAAVMCLKELEQFLGPFWKFFWTAAIDFVEEDEGEDEDEDEGEGEGGD